MGKDKRHKCSSHDGKRGRGRGRERETENEILRTSEPNWKWHSSEAPTCCRLDCVMARKQGVGGEQIFRLILLPLARPGGPALSSSSLDTAGCHLLLSCWSVYHLLVSTTIRWHSCVGFRQAARAFGRDNLQIVSISSEHDHAKMSTTDMREICGLANDGKLALC